MTQLLATKEFSGEVVLERSITPTVEPLGVLLSTMNLYKLSDDRYTIEWDCYDKKGEYVTGAEIGIWTDPEDTHVVTDYDGVFELPKEAIALLKENGFVTREVEV